MRTNKIDEDFLLANISSMTYDELADHFGVKTGAIRQFVSRLRAKGYEVPYRKWKKPGDLCYRKRNGAVFEYLKLGNGSWKYVRTVTSKPKQQKLKVKPIQTPPKKKKTVKKIIRTDGKRSPKKVEKRFATRQQDMTNMVWVKKDHKTYVLREKSKIAI